MGNKEETKSNICCIVFTVIGCVAVAALGFWAIWYFGIRKQPDTTGQREEGTSTPERESPGQRPPQGNTLTPPKGPYTWQWKDDAGKWNNYDGKSAATVEAAFQKYFKTEKKQVATITPAQGRQFEVEITGPNSFKQYDMEWTNGKHTGKRASDTPRDVRRAKGKISIHVSTPQSVTGRWRYK